MIQICAFKWGRKYTMEHVKRLRSMLARNLTIDWEFVLITDDPMRDRFDWEQEWHYPPLRIVPLWEELRHLKLCGVRLRAFGADMETLIGPRFAWVDLDVVILANVDHIFGRAEDFIALSTPQGPLAYNGSIVMMDAGARDFVSESWTPAKYAALPGHYADLGMHAGGESDEGWMTYALGPAEARFNTAWGMRADGIYFFRKDLLHGHKPLPADACMVILNGHANDPGNPKGQAIPWVRENWR